MKRLVLLLILIYTIHIKSLAQEKTVDTVFYTEIGCRCPQNEAHFIQIRTLEGDKYKFIEYFPDGKLHRSGYYESLISEDLTGKYQSYFKSGILSQEGHYVNGKESGTWKTFYNDGNLWVESKYLNGKLNGELKTFFDGKNLKREEVYKDDSLISSKCYAHDGKDTAYYPYREMPTFVGGEQVLYKYLASHVKYPKKSIRKGVEGIVKVRFSVDTLGNITKVCATKNVDKYLDAEAVRVVSQMPNWKPGKIEGELREMYFAIPIKFILQ